MFVHWAGVYYDLEVWVRARLPLLSRPRAGAAWRVQFAVFEALYTKWDNEIGRTELAGTAGLQLRVLGAGTAAAVARSVIECPIGQYPPRQTAAP